MNESPYVISGDLRRQEKKRLSLFKHFVKNFWFHEDCDRVYGGGMSDEDCNRILAEKQIEIDTLEKQLKETK